MRRLSAVLAALCALAAPASLLACSCAGPLTERDAAARSAAVFEGRVIWLRTLESGPYGGTREATFLVGGWTKGGRGRSVRVRTAASSCGIPFRLGGTYRVHASRGGAGSPLFTSICSGPSPSAAEPVALRASVPCAASRAR